MALRDRLEAGDDVVGRFWPAGTVARWQNGTAGLLQWSTTDGARLRLIPPHQGWPTDLRAPHMVVHGLTRENERLTLFDAWPKSISALDELFEIRADTILVDGHVKMDETWDGFAARTATLHEWLPLVGIEFTEDTANELGNLMRISMTWTSPEGVDLELPDAEVRLAPTMSTAARVAPEWSFKTNLDFKVRPTEACTLDDFRHRYLRALVALTVFASDRPDEPTDVRVWRRNQLALPVLARRRGLEAREWLTGSNFLFRAEDVDDVAKCLARWFELWALAEDSIATFCSTINEGGTWGPRHVTDVVTSLYLYGSRLRGIKKTGASLLMALRSALGDALRPIPLTRFDVQLMVGSRNYYAHLAEPSFEGVTVDLVQKSTFDTARRARAMMQVCLLGELGFSPDRVAALLEAHYQNWPLPDSAVPDVA